MEAESTVIAKPVWTQTMIAIRYRLFQGELLRSWYHEWLSPRPSVPETALSRPMFGA